MSDFEKCTGIDAQGRGCHVAHECYRHMAPSSEMQAWGPPAPDFEPKDGCDNYIPVGQNFSLKDE